MYMIGPMFRGHGMPHIVISSVGIDQLTASALSPTVAAYDNPSILSSLLTWQSHGSAPGFISVDAVAVWRHRIVIMGRSHNELSCCYYDSITNEYATMPLPLDAKHTPRLTVYNKQLYMWSREVQRVWIYHDMMKVWNDVPLLSAPMIGKRWISQMFPTSYGLLICAAEPSVSVSPSRLIYVVHAMYSLCVCWYVIGY